MLRKLADQQPIEPKQGDQEVWEDIKSGSRLAFSYLYDTYVDRLYAYGMKICPDQELVEDCIHDLFINIWKYRKNISIRSSLKVYLAISLKRAILNKVKERTKTVSLGESESHNFDVSPNIEDRLVQDQSIKEEKQKLQVGLSSLTKRQKEIVHLKFYDNFDYEEISEIMGLSVESTYNLVSKAISTLKNYFSFR